MPIVRVKKKQSYKPLLDSNLVGTRKANKELLNDKIRFSKKIADVAKHSQSIIDRYFGSEKNSGYTYPTEEEIKKLQKRQKDVRKSRDRMEKREE